MDDNGGSRHLLNFPHLKFVDVFRVIRLQEPMAITTAQAQQAMPGPDGQYQIEFETLLRKRKKLPTSLNDDHHLDHHRLMTDLAVKQ